MSLLLALVGAGSDPVEEPTPATGGAARPRMRYERVPKPEQFTLTDDDLAALALVLLEV